MAALKPFTAIGVDFIKNKGHDHQRAIKQPSVQHRASMPDSSKSLFRGYNQSVAILCELMGYQVKAKKVLSCGEMVFYVGFPASVAE